LLSFDHVRERLEWSVAASEDRSLAPTVVEQRVDRLLQHSLFVADDNFRRIQIDQLSEKYGISEFTLPNLYSNKLIGQNDRVKILGNGEIKSKLVFKVNAVSEKAKSAIEAAGGSVELIK